jgi:hypothetical protein
MNIGRTCLRVSGWRAWHCVICKEVNRQLFGCRRVAGRIGPEYVSSELNIGGSVVSSALCEVCGVSRSQLRELYKQLGDLGDVAQVREDPGWHTNH